MNNKKGKRQGYARSVKKLQEDFITLFYLQDGCKKVGDREGSKI